MKHVFTLVMMVFATSKTFTAQPTKADHIPLDEICPNLLEKHETLKKNLDLSTKEYHAKHLSRFLFCTSQVVSGKKRDDAFQDFCYDNDGKRLAWLARYHAKNIAESNKLSNEDTLKMMREAEDVILPLIQAHIADSKPSKDASSLCADLMAWYKKE